MNDSKPVSNDVPAQHISAGVATQTAWALAAKACGSALATITMVFVANLLPVSEYGLFSLVMSIAALWFILGEFGISLSVSKYVAQHRLHNPVLASGFVSCGLLLQAMCALVATVACYLTAGSIARLLGTPELQRLLYVAAAILLVRPLFRFALRIFQGYQRLDLLALGETLAEAVRLVATFMLLKAGMGALGAVGGRIAGFAVAAAVGLVIVWRKFLHSRGSWSAAGYPIAAHVIRLGIPVFAMNICDFLFMELTVPLLGFFLQEEQVGYYSLPFRITSVLHMPAHAVALAIGPRLAVLDENNEAHVRALFFGGMKTVLLLYIPAMFGLMALAPELLAVVFGEKYLPASTVMRMYGVFLLARAAGTYVALSLVYLGRARARAKVQVVTVLVNVGLNLALIPRFGIIGAAASMLATWIPTVVIWQAIACRTIDLRFSKLVYLAFRITICAAVMAVVAYLIGHDSFNLVRVLAAVVVAASVYAMMLLLTRTLTLAEVNRARAGGR